MPHTPAPTALERSPRRPRGSVAWLPLVALLATSATAAPPPDVEWASAEAERWRGLAIDGEIDVRHERRADLAPILGRLLENRASEAEWQQIEQALHAFGFLDPGVDLIAAYRALIGAELGGTFDPASGAVVLVEAPSDDQDLNTVLVHEIVHSLQHQHFGLDRVIEPDLEISDRRSAWLSVIEGDASHTMFCSMFGEALERIPLAAASLRPLYDDPRYGLDLVVEDVEERLAAAPPFLVGDLMFPYLHGAVFVLQVRTEGGQKLLDHAFVNPPTSTEQILHPERWIDASDPPLVLELPTLSPVLGPGRPPRITGTWGEWGIRNGLAARAPEVELWLGGRHLHDLRRGRAAGRRLGDTVG